MSTVVSLRSRRAKAGPKAPATHGACVDCGKISPIVVVPIMGPSEILYEAVSIQCAKCRYVIAELFRQRESHER